MPKLKLYKINGKLDNQNVEFVLKNNEISNNQVNFILKKIGGSNKVKISEPIMSEEKEFKTKDKTIKFKYLNSFSTMENETASPFYIYSLTFEGISSSGEKYYVDRVLGFFNKEKNKIDISDWRFRVNNRIAKELLKSKENEIFIALEEVKRKVDGNEVRELYVGTPLSLISELKDEKDNK